MKMLRLAFVFLTAALPLTAQQPGSETPVPSGGHNMLRPRVPSIAEREKNSGDQSRTLPNGVEVTHDGVTLRVTALRDDILRITAETNGTMPEDASWAVPAASRAATVAVTPDGAGFSTKQLRVHIDAATLRLRITDVSGNVLLSDSAAHSPEIRAKGGFTLWRDSPADEHYFGLGDKSATLDRRNQSFTLWNTDHGVQSTLDPLYKSIPYFMALRKGIATGLLTDDTWRTAFDFDKQERDTYIINAEGGALDEYFVYGPTPRQVVEDYAWLTGTPPLPPLWSLGYQQSRYSYYPESRVREVAARLRSDHIPCDVMWLDIDYQDRNRPFTVDKQRFPDMPKMIADLRKDNFRVVPITDLHIAYTPNDPAYQPYMAGHAQNAFVHNPDGSEFVGKVWPGASVFPDFTQDAARNYWGNLYQQFMAWGFAGFWNDMNEPAVFDGPGFTMPLDTVHRIAGSGFATRTATHSEIHNVFGMQQTRGTYDGMLKFAPDERPFVMTRASYAGGQRYAVTWTGDTYSTWEQLRLSTTMIENLGLSGFAFTGADVGGFNGGPSPALLTRWNEIAAFQPIDRNHSAKGTRDREPWVDGPAEEAVRRKYIELRYKMMPYNYTLAEETSRTGVPMVRPLFLEFPDAMPDKTPMDLYAGSQFMWGPDFLIALPNDLENISPYYAQLPPGGWYNFWTGAAVPDLMPEYKEIGEAMDAKEQDKPLTARQKDLIAQTEKWKITPDNNVLPVYVRAGSIVPMEALTQSTAETPDGPLELRVYPGANCRGSVYTDDGHSLEYQKGAYLRQEFSCEKEEDALRVKMAAPTGSYAPWWKAIAVTVYGWDGPGVQATDANGAKLNAKWYADAKAVEIIVPAASNATEIRLTKPTSNQK